MQEADITKKLGSGSFAELNEGGELMPYKSIKDLPDHLRKNMPTSMQRLFVNTFNKIVRDTEEDTSEGKAMKKAWEIVKKSGFAKGDLSGKWIPVSERMLSEGRIELQEEGAVPDTIQLLRVGSWEHPQYGTIEVSGRDLELFVESFENGARKLDLAIDQEHQPEKGAAGWINDLYKDGDGLFAEVEWTSLGKELLKDKRYKYISPELKFDYEDDETGENFQNVLFGAALTNRPFIKEMAPVAMSEKIEAWLGDLETQETIKGGQDEMKIESLDDLKKFNEEKIDELEITKEDVARELGLELDNGENEELTQVFEELNLDQEMSLDDFIEEVKTFKEKAELVEDKESKIEVLSQENKQLSERVENIEQERRQDEWERIKTKAMNEGRMTKKQATVFKERFMEEPEKTKEIIDTLEPVVEMGELGSKKSSDEDNTAIENFRSQAKTLAEEREVNYPEAMKMLAEEKPDLWTQVQEERSR